MFVERDVAGLDLRDRKHVVDEREQMLAGPLDYRQVFALFPGEPAIPLHELDEAEDRVHRRPQFVAHVREKRRLRPIRLERAPLGSGEGLGARSHLGFEQLRATAKGQDSEPMQSIHRAADGEDVERDRPPTAPDRRRKREAHRRADLVPHAVVVRRLHAKCVFARRQRIVVGDSALTCVDPVFLDAFQPVTETNLLGDEETQTVVMELEAAAARRQLGAVESGPLDSVNDEFRDDDGRRDVVEPDCGRIDHRHARDRRKPDATVASSPTRGL